MKVRIGLLMMIGLALVSSLAMAVSQKSYTGSCEPYTTGNWTVVLTFNDNGEVTRREGIACGGNAWVDHCPTITVSGDPGIGSNYFEPLAGGAWVRFNLNSSGTITDMWGRNTSGVYWKDPSSASLINFATAVNEGRN